MADEHKVRLLASITGDTDGALIDVDMLNTHGGLLVVEFSEPGGSIDIVTKVSVGSDANTPASHYVQKLSTDGAPADIDGATATGTLVVMGSYQQMQVIAATTITGTVKVWLIGRN